MRFSRWKPRILTLLFCTGLAALTPLAQPQKPPAAPQTGQAGKPIRVNVGLVQTDVMVFDRQGRFVPDLKPEQFELKVDEEVQPISFFELVSTGTAKDEEIWARAAGRPVVTPELQPAPRSSSDAGRMILMFVDDWHMSAESIMRARTALAKLVDTSMGVHDKAVICASSGQLGFLQQFTDNKMVLHAGLEKLNYMSPGVVDYEWPVINEFQAAMIEQGDDALFNYFVAACQKVNGTRINCKDLIRHRVDALAMQSANIGERTLSALRDLVRSAAVLPGRKIIFFLSDGFAVQVRSDVVERLRQTTDAAARAGIVIYSLDTRGLMVALPDIKTKMAEDTTAVMVNNAYHEIYAAQDGMNALASDTGGRLLKNTNALDTALSTSLTEISRYYLLGWYVDTETLKSDKYRRIHVAVKGRSDLKVRLRQGLVDLSALAANDSKKPDNRPVSWIHAGTELLDALQGPFPIVGLPVTLHAGYFLQPDKRLVLAISYQVDPPERENAPIDIMAAVANKNGLGVNTFKEILSFTPEAWARPGNKIFAHNRLVPIEPGIYQVRVAARDPRSGLIGCVWEWIDVPPYTAGKISMSSIFLKEQTGKDDAQDLAPGALDPSQISILRRFQAAAKVSFYLDIYNATGLDVRVESKIYRGNQIARQSAPKAVQVSQGGQGAGQIPYDDLLPIAGLLPGSYTLEVSAIDQKANASATQRISFWIQ